MSCTSYSDDVLLTEAGYNEQQTPLYPIAYSSNGEIYLSDVEGTSKIKITNFAGDDGYSAWSPDGKRIAFYAKYDDKKTWSIHTMNSDGSDRKRLTHEKNIWDSAPAWSPDGKKIAFARTYKGTDKIWQQEIWMMKADGSEQARIESLKGGGPYFAKDGRLVFHSQYTNKKSEISIADINGQKITQLTHNEAEEWHPEISPDGEQIAFMSYRDGNHEIYVMNIDGSGQKRLTFNDVRDSSPSWSPDGSQLIFLSRDEEAVPHIFLMNKDGSAIERIISNGSQAEWMKIREEKP